MPRETLWLRENHKVGSTDCEGTELRTGVWRGSRDVLSRRMVHNNSAYRMSIYLLICKQRVHEFAATSPQRRKKPSWQ